jgi:hypothetical protein
MILTPRPMMRGGFAIARRAPAAAANVVLFEPRDLEHARALLTGLGAFA